MKILVISILRLGDSLLQIPLLRGLQDQYPECEIHLLVNRQFSQVEELVEGIVDRVIYFERDLLQKSCGKKEFNLFWGYERLRTDLENINQVQYDIVYNFTHNKLSGFIAGLISAKERKGIFAVRGEFFGLTNPWIQFFNRYFGSKEASGFHYTELLARSLEIPLPYFSLRNRRQDLKNRILIQPLTSDAKKNWSLKNYAMLAKVLPNMTGCEVLVLGAPFEKEALAAHFTPEQLRICSLGEAAALLKESRLLITGDTSIKHLAAMAEVPTLELSLGSSQPLQVGSYSNSAVILQPLVECGPCPHSTPCSRSSHHCGQTLRIDAVASAVDLMIRSENPIWEGFTETHYELNVFRTHIRPVFGWTIECLSLQYKEFFEHVNQRKMMMVGDLDRRHQQNLKEDVNGQRTGKLSDGRTEATGKGLSGNNKDSGV